MTDKNNLKRLQCKVREETFKQIKVLSAPYYINNKQSTMGLIVDIAMYTLIKELNNVAKIIKIKPNFKNQLTYRMINIFN